MRRREESSSVAGAVTIPTTATFLSISSRALAIVTVGVVAVGFGLGDRDADGFGLWLEPGDALAFGSGSAVFTMSAGSRIQSR